MKIKPRKIDNRERMRYLDALYTAISGLKSRDEIKNFLKDLLTESERVMVGRRILIAQKLLENKTYEKIVAEMHVGFDTIMRVHRWLEDESDGYEKAVDALKKELNRRTHKFKTRYIDPLSFAGLKKRYPLHFFLFNLFDRSLKEEN